MKNRYSGLGYRRAALLGLLLVAFANGGCLWVAAGAAGGAAGYAYCKGKVCETYNASFADTMAATHTALQEFGMRVLHEEQHGTTCFIESRTGDGERVHVYLDLQQSKIPAEEILTRVCVRVATFGDRPFSGHFLDQVGSHLAPPGTRGVPIGPPSATLGGVQPSSEPAPAPLPSETAPPPLVPPVIKNAPR